MRESWIGLEAGVDARKWAGILRRAHDVALRSGQAPAIVRGVIADSWQRCERDGVDPGQDDPPLVLDPADADERWSTHPLAQTSDVLRSVLSGLLFDAHHIAVVSDADGCLLWSDGHPDVLRASEEIQFSPGHSWSEAAAGTNAIGTALATDHAVQVFSAEHFRSAIHGWQCSGAPIHDPETGAVLGAVDVSGRWDTASPHTLVLVQMAARLAEERLRAEMLARDARILSLFADHAARTAPSRPLAALSPSGRVLAATGTWGPALRGGRVELAGDGHGASGLDDGAELRPLGEGHLIIARARRRERRAPGCRIALLGHDRALVTTAEGSAYLTARHSEIVALLALHRDGMDARALSAALYGSAGHEVAVRSECHRLREVLGSVLATRPYRLTGAEVDAVALMDALGSGRRGRRRRDLDALAAAGPLLPGSVVAQIVAARERLTALVAAHAGE